MREAARRFEKGNNRGVEAVLEAMDSFRILSPQSHFRFDGMNIAVSNTKNAGRTLSYVRDRERCFLFFEFLSSIHLHCRVSTTTTTAHVLKHSNAPGVVVR